MFILLLTANRQGTLVQVFTQMTGINVINYYQNIMLVLYLRRPYEKLTQHRYKALGIVGSKATLVSGIYNVVGPLANLIFITFFLDRVGRRRPLLFGAVGITIALICEGALNSQNLDGSNHGYSIGGVVFLFCVTVLFSMSFGSISWVYMSEVMPMQIRGKGVAFATGIGNWTVSTLWSQVSPIALGKIGWKFYFIFAAWSMPRHATFKNNLYANESRCVCYHSHNLLLVQGDQAKVTRGD